MLVNFILKETHIQTERAVTDNSKMLLWDVMGLGALVKHLALVCRHK